LQLRELGQVSEALAQEMHAATARAGTLERELALLRARSAKSQE